MVIYSILVGVIFLKFLHCCLDVNVFAAQIEVQFLHASA